MPTYLLEMNRRVTYAVEVEAESAEAALKEAKEWSCRDWYEVGSECEEPTVIGEDIDG